MYSTLAFCFSAAYGTNLPMGEAMSLENEVGEVIKRRRDAAKAAIKPGMAELEKTGLLIMGLSQGVEGALRLIAREIEKLGARTKD